MQASDPEARSPWSSLDGVAEAELHPPDASAGGPAVRLAAAGSKSVTNRVLLLAAMAEGTSVVRNVLRSDDTYWCIDALKRLGVPIDVSADAVRIVGTGGDWPNRSGTLYAGAAGTVARFLPGVLAASERGEWRLEGSRSLSDRPVGPLVEALGRIGADIRCEAEPGRLPLAVSAKGLRGGRVVLSGGLSSQFISGVLMASPYAAGPTEIVVPDGIVQHAYVGITVDLMKRFGVTVEHDERYGRLAVKPGRYAAQDTAVEADASTACYYLAFAALTGRSVRVDNLPPETRQPDAGFVRLLERMGCAVDETGGGVEVRGPAGGRLRGGFAVSMKEMSDQTMTLAALAPFADGPIAIGDVAHIRGHECDRIAATCESLRRLGIDAEERRDGLTIRPGTPKPSGALPTYDDHRMAMSLALIGARVPGVRLLDPGCVSKTNPPFFDELRRLGMGVRLTPNG
ncbi:3-phosphoshikimate 1-carboxyvinyltransferase [Paenibacillus flagellatus]|uniref:3-phosphoshikimate 1-carboxyvinyltransferase n=1 Tax=Paenibacillus flagellatus TaxID=2211139 RepID=A0A2V5JZ41_9BACL|nr:3-phosphoshikimate 1-carboxyvinyltransferase [Paenibacillus flagellatus]PYI52088.1 3-phosphoshikimate 1-carboxyvinyltransferase [Paenibacillus flagellatus]